MKVKDLFKIEHMEIEHEIYRCTELDKARDNMFAGVAIEKIRGGE